jgi:hypothetical protein
MGGFAVSGMALAILTVCKLSAYPPWDEWLTVNRLHDLGNLQLAFTLFWSYVSFMQFLIIWSGNIPEEAGWYKHRMDHGWQTVAMLLIGLHFVLPFLLLLSRDTKRSPTELSKVVLLLLAMRLIDLFWLVQPTFTPESVALHWAQVVPLVAIGGLFLALFAWRLPARAALPVFELTEETGHGTTPTHAH